MAGILVANVGRIRFYSLRAYGFGRACIIIYKAEGVF